MKKEYAKPYLAIESFQLVAALAGACSNGTVVPLNQNISTCEAAEQGLALFAQGVCEQGITDDGLCYQGPVAGQTYATS